MVTSFSSSSTICRLSLVPFFIGSQCHSDSVWQHEFWLPQFLPRKIPQFPLRHAWQHYDSHGSPWQPWLIHDSSMTHPWLIHDSSMTAIRQENFAYQHWDDILEICKQYDVWPAQHPCWEAGNGMDQMSHPLCTIWEMKLIIIRDQMPSPSDIN